MKMWKLAIVLFLMTAGWALPPDGCTDNTDFSWNRGGTLWRCAHVGDGSDASCTNGSRWILFSDLWHLPM